MSGEAIRGPDGKPMLSAEAKAKVEKMIANQIARGIDQKESWVNENDKVWLAKYQRRYNVRDGDDIYAPLTQQQLRDPKMIGTAMEIEKGVATGAKWVTDKEKEWLRLFYAGRNSYLLRGGARPIPNEPIITSEILPIPVTQLPEQLPNDIDLKSSYGIRGSRYDAPDNEYVGVGNLGVVYERVIQLTRWKTKEGLDDSFLRSASNERKDAHPRVVKLNGYSSGTQLLDLLGVECLDTKGFLQTPTEREMNESKIWSFREFLSYIEHQTPAEFLGQRVSIFLCRHPWFAGMVIFTPTMRFS